MPGCQQIHILVAQGALLIFEHLKGEPGIELGIVDAAAAQLAVLVMFYEVVIWILGECQRVEHQRVHRGHLVQAKMRGHSAKSGKVEVDQVVTQHKGLALCQVVKAGQRLVQSAVPIIEEEGPARTGRYCGKGMDAVVVTAHFKVQRQAVDQRHRINAVIASSQDVENPLHRAYLSAYVQPSNSQ